MVVSTDRPRIDTDLVHRPRALRADRHAFELFAARRASFSLLERGGLPAVAALPMLAFSAPSSSCATPCVADRGAADTVRHAGDPDRLRLGPAVGRIALDLAAMLVGA